MGVTVTLIYWGVLIKAKGARQNNKHLRQAWCCVPVIPAPWRVMLEDCGERQDSQSYIARPSPKSKQGERNS